MVVGCGSKNIVGTLRKKVVVKWNYLKLFLSLFQNYWVDIDRTVLTESTPFPNPR